MSDDINDILTKHANGDAARMAAILDEADVRLVAVLSSLDESTRRELLTRFVERVSDEASRFAPPAALTPEVMRRLNEEMTVEDHLIGVEEIRVKGGLTFEQMLPALERAVGGDE